MSAVLARLRLHLRIIDADVAAIAEEHRVHIQCRPGCSECCSQSFMVSELEGELLQEGLRLARPAVAAEILARAQQHAPGSPCPVLSEVGTCQLYEHRPRICRKYGIPLWSADRPDELRTCRLNFRGVEDLDAERLVEPQAMWAADWIELREELQLGPALRRTIAAWLLDRSG